MASRLLQLRRLSRLLLKPPSSNFRPSSYLLLEASRPLHLPDTSHGPLYSIASRSFCSSPPFNLNEGPAAIDYSSVLQEDEFHKLADSTIHDLQEKFEEYGDSVQVDGFDIDYGNEVLTLKLGDLGTYVLNKQTPNRQLWLSSPVSGPFRFDWDRDAEAWIYRRTKVKLLTLLETEMEQLCGEPISLS
ncbi:PREDICTED: frataxin, mitochondrial [Fragaria vesca subsp. vesca]|uniref:frataxin, mitochondrial n=1 Tax=Fragaria vesca subsp. vesca TaxID=101020 RepID=UPI0002C3123E|nr:PREDICTED: frataxin, mitochondrial [Fragaria vesca subsp. vesca]